MKISAGSTAVVTGGSSGLGKTLCLELARRGVTVAIADLDTEGAAATLQSLQPSGSNLQHFSVACDIRRSEDFVSLRHEIEKRWMGRLNLLVNNAGIARAGNITQTSEDDWQLMLDTNLMGVIRGCRELLPLLSAASSAYLVNIASFAGLACAPGMISYNVAKAGVIALSESLRAELQPLGIGVSVACPAFFATNLLRDFNAPPEVTAKVQRMMQRSETQASDVAAGILDAVARDQFMIIAHRDARRAYLLKRFLPQQFFKVILKQTSNMYRKTKDKS